MENFKDINEAIRTYIGFGKSIAPINDLETLSSQYSLELKNQVLVIIEELNKTNIDWSNFDLIQGSRFAVSQICDKYPFIEDETRKAMEWKFSFDWR